MALLSISLLLRLAGGGPLLPVLVGCGFAALLTWRQLSRQTTECRNQSQR